MAKRLSKISEGIRRHKRVTQGKKEGANIKALREGKDEILKSRVFQLSKQKREDKRVIAVS